MIDEKIIEGLREYIKDHYIPAGNSGISVSTSIGAESYCYSICRVHAKALREERESSEALYEDASFRKTSDEASEYIKKHRKPGGFAHTLDRLRNEKRLSPAELYKRANIDRRQYSRFMGPEGRHPSMNTVLSFAIALRLDRSEFDEFLQTAVIRSVIRPPAMCASCTALRKVFMILMRLTPCCLRLALSRCLGSRMGS